MTSPLPVAVLGGGLIGRRHAALAASSPVCRLTAVVEPDALRRDRLARDGLPAVADFEAIPADTRAAIVAAPTPLHRPLAADCAARGWAVLVEKPVAGTLAEADALIAACRDVPVLVGHHRRHHPLAAALREALAAGVVGEVLAVQGLWTMRKPDAYFANEWRAGAGGGPGLINLIHDIDLMRWVVGEIAEVSALHSTAARNGDVEDGLSLALRFETGALGSFLTSDAALGPWGFEAATGENPGIAHTGADCLRIVGTEGALAFPSMTLWRHDGDGPGDWSRPLSRHELPRPEGPPPLEAQLAHFAAAARGAAAPLIDGADGRATLAATLAAKRAGETGRVQRPDDVPPDYGG